MLVIPQNTDFIATCLAVAEMASSIIMVMNEENKSIAFPKAFTCKARAMVTTSMDMFDVATSRAVEKVVTCMDLLEVAIHIALAEVAFHMALAEVAIHMALLEAATHMAKVEVAILMALLR